MACLQCGEKIKEINKYEFLYYCVNPKCPNFHMVQISL